MTTTDHTQLATAIRQVRADQSQQAFATWVGCSIASLQRWEAGYAAPQRWVHVERLHEAGVPRDSLLAALEQ